MANDDGDPAVFDVGRPGTWPLPSPAEMAARNRVDAWADDVRRLVPEVVALRDRYVHDQALSEHGEDEGLTELEMYLAWIRLLTAQHHLVWAAYQLERWVARLARERSTTAPASDPMLGVLRNVLEHLDEAEFADYGVSTPGKRSRSHHQLPGKRLDLDTSNSKLLFGVVDPKALERRAHDIKTTPDWLLQWAAEGWAAQWPGEDHGQPETERDEDGGEL